MTVSRFILVVLLAAPMLAMAPQDDKQKIAELERKVAELERRLKTLEMQLYNVPLIRVGGTTITRHHFNMARDAEAIRSGGAKTDAAIALDLAECAAHREILLRLGILLTAEEIGAERAKGAQDPLAPKLHALLDSYPGMFDLIAVLPKLASSKLTTIYQTDKRANQAIVDRAEALLRKALTDPSALGAAGRDKAGEYRRMDTKSLNGGQKEWAKQIEEKYLDDLKDGQVLPKVLELEDGYYIMRLIDSRKHSCAFEYVLFRRGTFEPWLKEQLAAIEFDVVDPNLKKDLLTRPAGHPVGDRIAGR